MIYFSHFKTYHLWYNITHISSTVHIKYQRDGMSHIENWPGSLCVIRVMVNYKCYIPADGVDSRPQLSSPCQISFYSMPIAVSSSDDAHRPSSPQAKGRYSCLLQTLDIILPHRAGLELYRYFPSLCLSSCWQTFGQRVLVLTLGYGQLVYKLHLPNEIFVKRFSPTLENRTIWGVFGL